MLSVWGNRRITLARELTKRYEEFARGTLEEALSLLEEHPPLGEYCLVVEGISPEEAAVVRNGDGTVSELWWQGKSLQEHVEHYAAQGSDRKDAMKKAAKDRGLSRRDVYNELHAD
ncbi:Ribosomal RNA small subunit methyltransferase I [compost metagenome]